MTITRPAVFWIAISSILLLALLLLRPILMPFAMGLALAYLLVPAVERLEQVGFNRALAASLLVLLLVAIIAGGTLVMLPAIVGELRFLVAEFPRYVARMQWLVMDTSRPWLHNLISEELHSNEQLVKIATTTGEAWFDETVRVLWSSGESSHLSSRAAGHSSDCQHLFSD